MFVWSGLIGIVQMALTTFLILSKGTSHGVTTSLAFLLPAQAVGAKATILHSILSKFDIFTVWQLILWILGVAVVYKFTVKKSATMIISIWAAYVIIAVVLGQLMGGLF